LIETILDIRTGCRAALGAALGALQTAPAAEREGSMSDIDMRIFASRAGTNVTFPAGSNVFAKGDPGNCMYVIQSGAIEIVIGDKVVEVCGPNEALGFMSVIDGSSRTSTARVRKPRNCRSSMPANSAS
jgi:CRP-like cAMP-binding protein